MAKRISVKQLVKAFASAPTRVEIEGKKYIIRGLAAYKREAVQSSPWRVGQSGGGIPRDTGNLRERHKTWVASSGLRGTFGVNNRDVPYAKYVHGRGEGEVNKRTGVTSRPWLLWAKTKATPELIQLEKRFADAVLKHIAT